jgi:hypothetical protein
MSIFVCPRLKSERWRFEFLSRCQRLDLVDISIQILMSFPSCGDIRGEILDSTTVRTSSFTRRVQAVGHLRSSCPGIFETQDFGSASLYAFSLAVGRECSQPRKSVGVLDGGSGFDIHSVTADVHTRVKVHVLLFSSSAAYHALSFQAVSPP